MAQRAKMHRLKMDAAELAHALHKAGIIESSDICLPKVDIDRKTIILEWTETEQEQMGFYG